jgi:hypothetical protein
LGGAAALDLVLAGGVERFGKHLRTDRQALESAVPPSRKPPPARVSPAIGSWKSTIDAWLAEDKLRAISFG